MHALERLARGALAPAVLIVVLAVGLPASPLFAQTAGGERIVFVPDAVPAGFTGTIEVIALDGELFAQSSATPPALSFPATGALTITVSQLAIRSPKRATATLVVPEGVLGAARGDLRVFSLDGTEVSVQATGYLGVTGPAVVQPNFSVIVASMPVLETDVPGAQRAGDFALQGPLNGAVVVTAPVGCTFVQSQGLPGERTSRPRVTSSGVTISTPVIAPDLRSFTIAVVNTKASSISTTFSNIRYDTSAYTASGGQPGPLTIEIASDALPAGPLLVDHAKTRGFSLENPPPEEPAGETNPASEPGTSGAGVPGTGYLPTASQPRAREPRQPPADDRTARQPSRSVRSPSRARNTRSNNNRRRWRGRGGRWSRGRSGPGSSRVAPARPSRIPAARDLTRETTDAARDALARRLSRLTDERVYAVRLTDRGFRPLTALGLKPEAGGLSGRVWVEVVLEADRDPSSRGVLALDLRVPGAVAVAVTLTETAADSGIYRSGGAGVPFTIPWDAAATPGNGR